jgi:two-component system, OmpR family, response regulator
MAKVLVAEDDEKLNRIVCHALTGAGYDVTGCLNVHAAYGALYNNPFDLIVSDIMMPEIDGFEFAKTVRSLNSDIPILFMTARDDLSSKQKGFSAGIDDYMVKPIVMDELLLRVAALLRRAKISDEKRLEVGNFIMDAGAMSALVAGAEVPTTVREFNILFKLLSYPGQAFSRAQLMDEFWEAETDTGLRAVDVYITRLRDKFSACDGFTIKTVHGLGYKVVLS